MPSTGSPLLYLNHNSNSDLCVSAFLQLSTLISSLYYHTEQPYFNSFERLSSYISSFRLWIEFGGQWKTIPQPPQTGQLCRQNDFTFWSVQINLFGLVSRTHWQNCHSIYQPVELLMGNAQSFLWRPRLLESSGAQTLVQKQKAIALEKESLDSVGPSAAEKKSTPFSARFI